MNIEQLRWALAGAKRLCECQYCQEPEQGVVPNHSPFGYVLPDSVRVECPDEEENVGWSKDGVHTEFGYRPFQNHPHAICRGLGYTPATDLETWAKGLWPVIGGLSDHLLPEAAFRYIYMTACARGDLEAALRISHQVMEHQGCKLEE